MNSLDSWLCVMVLIDGLAWIVSNLLFEAKDL